MASHHVINKTHDHSITFKTPQDITVNATQHIGIHSVKGNISLTAPRDSVHIQHGQAFHVQGTGAGPVTMKGGKSSMQFTKDGEAIIQAPKIIIEADDIHFHGDVVYNNGTAASGMTTTGVGTDVTEKKDATPEQQKMTVEKVPSAAPTASSNDGSSTPALPVDQNKNMPINYYIVNYEGMKMPIAKSVGGDALNALGNFDLSEGFEEDRWMIKPSKTLGEKSDEALDEEKSNFNYHQMKKYNKATMKGEAVPKPQLVEIDTKMDESMSKESMVKTSIAGSVVGGVNLIDNTISPYYLLKQLQQIQPKIEAMMPAQGGVLIKADYNVGEVGDDGKVYALKSLVPVYAGEN